jgi:DNA-binding response OmpR family regulator
MRHEGTVVSRGMLVRDVWKYSTASTAVDNLIDVHVARLRRKIDAHREHKLIHTIRGVGFMLREERP